MITRLQNKKNSNSIIKIDHWLDEHFTKSGAINKNINLKLK